MAPLERSTEFISPQPKNFPYAHLGDSRSIGLSHRQSEVFELAINSYKVKYIGYLLGISPKTVQKHLSGISAYHGLCEGRGILGIYGLIEKAVGKRIVLPELIPFLIKNNMLSLDGKISAEDNYLNNQNFDLEYDIVPFGFEKFGMTTRQSKVFNHWINGLTTKQIAHELSWPLNTVENQIYGYNERNTANNEGLLNNLENIIGFRPTQAETIIYFWSEGMLMFKESAC